MSAVEKFNEWLARTEPDQYGNTLAIVIEKLKKAGYDGFDVQKAIKDMQYWLIQNEGSPKVNKLHWGKFIMNWMRPKNYRQSSARLTPSKFE